MLNTLSSFAISRLYIFSFIGFPYILERQINHLFVQFPPIYLYKNLVCTSSFSSVSSELLTSLMFNRLQYIMSQNFGMSLPSLLQEVFSRISVVCPFSVLCTFVLFTLQCLHYIPSVKCKLNIYELNMN